LARILVEALTDSLDQVASVDGYGVGYVRRCAAGEAREESHRSSLRPNPRPSQSWPAIIEPNWWRAAA